MRVFRPLVFVVALLCASITLVAQPSAIKLGTIVPDGSIWHKALKQMGADWSQATGGRVKVIIYAGGIQGTEADMVRRMRVNQLQAAGMTGPGLAEIDPSFNVFTVPFFFASDDELRYVLDKLTPTLKQRLDAKGYVLLNWGRAGWVNVFSRKEVHTLDDLRKVRIFTSEGDDQMVQWYKTNGFTPVALPYTEITSGLKSGLFDAVPTPPLAALSFQWFRDVPFMIDVGLAPFVGGTVVRKQTWEATAETDRPKLLEAAARAEQTLDVEVPKKDAESIAVMEQRGLKVIKVDAARTAEFRSLADKFVSATRGSMVPEDIFDMALRERNAFRQAKR